MTVDVERLARDYMNSLKRDRNLDENDIDFTLLLDPLVDLAVVGHFAAIDSDDLTLARNRRYNTPFRKQMRSLRQQFGVDEVEDVRGRKLPGALSTLEDLNVTTRRRILDAVQAGNPETLTDRRAIIARELSVADGQIQTQVRTTASAAYNGAHYVQSIGDPDVWGYVYLTEADDRVRDTHAAMHGVVRDKQDPIWSIWWPPNGWNCRCITMSIADERQETDLRTIGGARPDEGFAFNSGQQVLLE